MTGTDSSEQRYQRLFDLHHRDVYAYCRRRTDADTAADAAAETFLVAWRRLDDIPEGGASLGWLYGVARRVLANEFRRTKRSRGLFARLPGDPPAAVSTPEVVVVQQEQEAEIHAALAQLRIDDQELLRLALWEEAPHAEIAAAPGCSLKSPSMVRAMMRVWFAYVDYTDVEHTNLIVDGSTVVIVSTRSGTSSTHARAGSDPTPFEAATVTVFELDDGLIAVADEYYEYDQIVN